MFDPKEQNIQIFRPINLVNCCYKIIFKVLTNILAPYVNKLVDQAQAAFIHGRFILDNVLTANKILYFTKIRNKKRYSS
jgi:Reverse transcriptase (RNA-dependent DNA polymerase)